MFNFENPQANNVDLPESSIEKIKPPFFIQEATLTKTLEQIDKVPPEKRKIIVYVGFHPNEATAELVRKYSEDWAERYNVLVVSHPTDENVQAFWKKREGMADPKLSAEDKIDESHYQDEFARGEPTVFIRFHGTPIEQYKDQRPPEKNFSRLDIELPIKGAKAFQGIEDNKGKFPHAQKEQEQNAYEHWRPLPENEAVIEYWYHGEPVKVEDPHLQKVLEAWHREPDERKNSLFSENWDRQMNIGPSYLDQHSPSEEDRRKFDEEFASQFAEMLETISRNLDNKK